MVRRCGSTWNPPRSKDCLFASECVGAISLPIRRLRYCYGAPSEIHQNPFMLPSGLLLPTYPKLVSTANPGSRRVRMSEPPVDFLKPAAAVLITHPRGRSSRFTLQAFQISDSKEENVMKFNKVIQIVLALTLAFTSMSVIAGNSNPHQRPFWGSFEGEATFPFTGACSDLTGVPFETLSQSMGHMTHMGRTGRFDGATGSPEGMVYIEFLGFEVPNWPLEFVLTGRIVY